LDKIKERKHPADPAKLYDKGNQTMERYRQLFPLDLSVKKGEVPTPFPILIDADRKLSKGLGLFMTKWGGDKVDQNIPSVYIVDAEGRSSSSTSARTPWTSRNTIISSWSWRS
jgi:hypothetical protein